MHTPSTDLLMACSDSELLLIDTVLDMLLDGHATQRSIHLNGGVLDHQANLALATAGTVFRRLGWPKSCFYNQEGHLLLTFESNGHNSRLMTKGGDLWASNDRMTAHTALLLHAARATIHTVRRMKNRPEARTDQA